MSEEKNKMLFRTVLYINSCTNMFISNIFLVLILCVHESASYQSAVAVTENVELVTINKLQICASPNTIAP